MIALWAVIPAMALMFIAGRRSAFKRRMHFINNTNYGLNIQVSGDRKVILIEEGVRD
jgi:hypothetical protein